MNVRAEQKGKGVGRGGYPIDEEKSKQLKLVADKMDAFFAHSDEAAFDAVASPDITLHGDLLILDNDLSGADKVKQTLGTYTKLILTAAVSSTSGCIRYAYTSG